MSLAKFTVSGIVVVQGGKAAPFPSCVVLALQLMGVLTSQPEPMPLQASKKRRGLPSYAASVILTLQVHMPSNAQRAYLATAEVQCVHAGCFSKCVSVC